MTRFLILYFCFLILSCSEQNRPVHPPVTHDAVAIAYNRAGAGDTAVVLVHGWAINKEYWQAQMATLAKRFTVVAPDLAGHGQSGHNRKSWTIRDFAGDVEAVIQTMDLDKVILVGHSMGGDVILEIAKDIPDKVIGFIGIDNFKDLSDSVSPARQKAMDQFLQELRQNYRAVAGNYSRARLFPPDYSDSFSMNRVLYDIENADSVMAVQSIQSVMSYNESLALSKLNLPVHLIVSDYTPVNESALKLNCRDGYFIRTIHGTGHYPMIEKPAEFNTLLKETLDDIAAGH